MGNIKLKHLIFGYAADILFDDAELVIDENWRLGLVGRNGRGKTTLLKLMTGELTADSLQLTRQKTAKQFVYFPQTVADKSQLTLFVLQELAEFEEWQLTRELSLLHINADVLYRPFDSLSGGEQTKALLAVLFLAADSFPLLDEPTNHLDLPSREIVAAYLSKKSGFIVVSHDRDFLNKVTDHTLAIERAQLVLHAGNFAMYEAEKKLRDTSELTENQRLKKDIARLKTSAQEKEKWSRSREKTKDASADSGFVSARAARVMKKSKNLEKRQLTEIADKEKLLTNLEKVDRLEMQPTDSHHKILVSADKLQLKYDETALFQPVSFELKSGEILALTGANGTGKSSLLQALTGDFSGEYSGKLTLAHNLQVSCVRQIFQNKGHLHNFSEEKNLDLELFLNNLRKLGLPREAFSQRIETMSQGQQKKVELAKSLSEAAELYIWDEPLNYLDVFNQEQLAKLLQSTQATMLLVEHDRTFIDKVATSEIRLEKGYNKSYE